MPVRAFQERRPSLKAGAREAENHDDTLCPHQARCQENSPRRAEILGARCTNVAHVNGIEILGVHPQINNAEAVFDITSVTGSISASNFRRVLINSPRPLCPRSGQIAVISVGPSWA